MVAEPEDNGMRPPYSLSKGSIVSHYKILEKLGEGGMGVVYKAEDSKLKRTVALKFLPAALTRDPEAKRRFIQEAQAASVLDHPNICTIYEINETEDGRMFISMACYEGRTVKEKIESGPLGLEEALNITIQVAEGLREAHEKGIVHRDIKSANIMVTTKGQVKIMDFGLAKLAGQVRLTKVGTTAGTVAYMSPEQAQGEEVDHRTDIWSLGVVLYEMVTGELPFRGDYEQAVIYSILNEEPESIPHLRSGVPMELEQVVNRALEKSLDRRYQQMGQMLADLESLRGRLEPSVSIGGFSPSEHKPSIAVLPFTNLSADPEQEYFCDGMAEEIINALSHVKGLWVVARTSAFVFKGKSEDIREIGRKLNVETLLEGSVRKAGNRLRISAQLINVADGYHIWSEKYDREMEDVFAIQDEIALAIVDKLKIKLLGGEEAKLKKRHTEDAEAHNLYLRGRYFWNKRTEEGLEKATQFFNQAIERDPDYALAYAGLADVYNMLYSYQVISRKEAHQKAKEFALKALEIDDSLSEAHASMAMIEHIFQNNLDGAERECRRALVHNPGYATAHHWYSILLEGMGRFEEAVREEEYALRLDPLSPVINIRLATIKSRLGDWDGAKELYKRVLEIDPTNEISYASYAVLLAQMGRVEEGLSEIQRALELAPNSAMINIGYGWVLYLSRRYDQALEQLQKALEIAPFSFDLCAVLGLVYLEKGMYEEALGEFQKAKELLPASDLKGKAALQAMAGIAYAKMGERTKAQGLLGELGGRSKGERPSPVYLAWLSFALGKVGQGFQWLERAYEEHDELLCYLQVDPRFDGVRSDPRFGPLLEKMGLGK